MFKNLIASLISCGRIKTTEAKAKAVKGLVDRLVTKAKKGSLHARRQVLTFLSKKEVVKKLFDEIAPGFKGRKAGFTRMIKIGPRRGDNASMVIMEWVEQKTKDKKQKTKNDQHKANKGKRH